MTTTGTPPDTSWMTPWELWAWEQIAQGERADMEYVPVESRGDADLEKQPVSRAIFKNAESQIVRIDDVAWPAWQEVTARFVESVLTHPEFVSRRRRNTMRLLSARIRQPINLDSANISGGFDLSFCQIDGDLEMSRATVSGGVGFRGTLFLGMFAADDTDVSKSLFLGTDARFEREVRLIGAKIGGDLICSGSHFAMDSNGDSLSADRITIGGNVFLEERAVFEGTVRLSGASVGGQIQIQTGTFLRTVDLTSIKVDGEFRLDEKALHLPGPIWSRQTRVDMQNARFGALQGSIDAWRCEEGFVTRNLDGLRFHRLAGGVGGDSLNRASVDELVDWLETDTVHNGKPDTFSPSPYLAVANALETAGAADKARKVRIALEERITRSKSWFSVSAPNKFGRNFIMGPMTAYGYEPMRATFWFGGLVIVFAALGLSWELMAAAEYSPPGLRDILAWLGFSFESALPLIDLDPVSDTFLEDRFGVSVDAFGDKAYQELPSGLRALFAAERILGLIILSVLVAGLTGWAETRGK